MTAPTKGADDLSPQSHTVLVVDDSSANLTMLTDYLADSGFATMTASTGKAALEIAGHTPPHLILLDVVMPGLDGFETCRQLKATPPLQDIPVIFMTALSSTEDKIKGFQAGAVDYITKPFRQEEILARVTTHLQIRDLTRSLQTTNQDLLTTLDNLKATQAQLVESEKMAALGGLVSGMAHTINTPLGIGVTAASALELETRNLIEAYQNDKMTRTALQSYFTMASKSSQLILDNLLRAADLVRSFKQVAVDQSSVGARTFSVKSYIEDTIRSVQSKIDQSQLRIIIAGDDDVSITSYPGVFAQVITNLILNSLTHAYPKNESGRIRFLLEQQEDHVMIEYSDDGCGIPAEHVTKIFDPFFTTARNRGGIGLGMYIVYNLVTQKLRGTIQCESRVGVGTTFTIALPLR